MLFESELKSLARHLGNKEYNPAEFTVTDLGHSFVQYTGASKLPITVWFKNSGPKIVSGSYNNTSRPKYKSYIPLSQRHDYLLDNSTVLEVYKTNTRLSSYF